MGATGSGKSTFINLVTGSSLGIGRGLRSRTNAVQLIGPFSLDGRRAFFVDTPGFDDTMRSDTDVLQMIATFLAASMGGVLTRNLKVFRKLCGDGALHNVVVVTNMWEEVDPWISSAREAELMEEDIFFKPLLDRGARMARHNNTLASAESIIRLVLDNRPLPLQIQVELVDKHKDISETSAGEELNRELSTLIMKKQEEIRVLKEEMGRAVKDKEDMVRREFEVETKRMQKEIEKLETSVERLAFDCKGEGDRLEAQIEARARQEVDRVVTQYQGQIDELRNSLQADAATPKRDQVLLAIVEKINELRAGDFSVFL